LIPLYNLKKLKVLVKLYLDLFAERCYSSFESLLFLIKMDEYPYSGVEYTFSVNENDMINIDKKNISKKYEITNQNGFWKYNEDKILKEIKEYLGSTYKSHYTSQESKTQTLDLIESIGDAEPFCRSNAIKYLSRFGKKNGKSKMDILKAIHYCILLYHFAGLCNETKNPYETF